MPSAAARVSPVLPRDSVVVPPLNESATLAILIERVLASRCATEVLIVDDGSTDATGTVAHGLAQKHPDLVRVFTHPTRRGKGAAIRTALARAQGDVLLVQDADLEYDPADYPALLAPFADPAVQVVYGSRNLRPNPRSTSAFYWGGRLLSRITNFLYGSRLTDESTGFKLVRIPLLRALALRGDGFEFCDELTGRLLRRGLTIHEVPIRYRPRSIAEGKKIRWHHGLTAIKVLLHLRFAGRVDSPSSLPCATAGLPHRDPVRG